MGKDATVWSQHRAHRKGHQTLPISVQLYFCSRTLYNQWEICTGSLSEKINRVNSLLEILKRQSRHISQLLYNVTHILEILCCKNLHHCLICSFKETSWTQALHREYKKKTTQFLKIFWLISKMDDGAVCVFGLIYGSAGVFSITLRS